MSLSTPRIFMIAGEPSGDFLGARLIQALREIYPASEIKGVGGHLMKEQGVTSPFPLSEIAVMGISELFLRIPCLLKRIRQTAADIQEFSPQVLVTIDSSGFCWRVIKKIKKNRKTDPYFVHYVAPCVWAWRPKRAQKLALLVDHLLTLFSFEPPHFTKYGLPTTYVGHPLTEVPSVQKDTTFRYRHNIPENACVLVILPGSRVDEICRLLPVFLKTALLLKKKGYTPLHLLMPTLPSFRAMIEENVKGFDLPLTVITDEKQQAFWAADVALAASGTVSLELALAETPMVIGYKIAPFTYTLLRRILKVKMVCLVNILLGKKVVPELLQDQCTPESLAESLEEQLESRKMDSFLREIRGMLSPEDGVLPSERAARVIGSFLDKSSSWGEGKEL